MATSSKTTVATEKPAAKKAAASKKVAEKFEIQNTDYARAKTLMAEGNFDDAIAIYGKYKDQMAVQSAKATKGAYYESRGQLQDALQADKDIYSIARSDSAGPAALGRLASFVNP